MGWYWLRLRVIADSHCNRFGPVNWYWPHHFQTRLPQTWFLILPLDRALSLSVFLLFIWTGLFLFSTMLILFPSSNISKEQHSSLTPPPTKLIDTTVSTPSTQNHLYIFACYLLVWFWLILCLLSILKSVMLQEQWKASFVKRYHHDVTVHLRTCHLNPSVPCKFSNYHPWRESFFFFYTPKWPNHSSFSYCGTSLWEFCGSSKISTFLSLPNHSPGAPVVAVYQLVITGNRAV